MNFFAGSVVTEAWSTVHRAQLVLEVADALVDGEWPVLVPASSSGRSGGQQGASGGIAGLSARGLPIACPTTAMLVAPDEHVLGVRTADCGSQRPLEAPSSFGHRSASAQSISGRAAKLSTMEGRRWGGSGELRTRRAAWRRSQQVLRCRRPLAWLTRQRKKSNSRYQQDTEIT